MSKRSVYLSVVMSVLLVISVFGCNSSDRASRLAEKNDVHKAEINKKSERMDGPAIFQEKTGAHPGLHISGEVRQNLTLQQEDLKRLHAVTTRTNEVSRSGHYHGAFTYRGPSLRSLLEFAGIEKKKPDFNKDLDLVIVVQNSKGEEIALSWGEIFYRNPGDIIVAVEAAPIRPHHERNRIPRAYWPWLDQLDREIGFPKLVVANDFYSDRSIEGIRHIQVIDLHPDVRRKKQKILFSPSFSICGAVATAATVSALPEKNYDTVLFKEVGDGQGYHGLKTFGGVPLVDLLEQAGIGNDLDTVVLISAPDGYRTVLSYGELFLSTVGKDILIGDTIGGEYLTNRGRFFVLLPDDLSADRSVKAIQEIRVIKLNQRNPSD